MIEMSEFGKYIKKIRESKGLTLNQVALYSDISAAQLSRIENGKRGVPKPNTIKGIAEALKCDYNHLMKIAGYIEEETDISNVRTSKNEEKVADETFDSLTEINKLLQKYGFDQSGFFDIEKWKNMGPEEIKQLESYFEFIAEQAKKKNEENN
jgi:HTH-type transcriptional regulator, competence development regulator